MSQTVSFQVLGKDQTDNSNSMFDREFLYASRNRQADRVCDHTKQFQAK